MPVSRNNRHSLSNRKSLPPTLPLPGKSEAECGKAFTQVNRMGKMRWIGRSDQHPLAASQAASSFVRGSVRGRRGTSPRGEGAQ